MTYSYRNLMLLKSAFNGLCASGIMHIAFFLLFFSFALVAKAQTQVHEFKPGVSSDGVTYMLPKTKIRVKVRIVNTVYTPGEFSKYAERYLFVKDAIEEKRSEWSIEGISVDYIGVPDTSKVYTVKLKDKTVAPLVSLSDDGLLLSINEIVQSPVEEPLEADKTEELNEDGRKYLTAEALAASTVAKMAEVTSKEIYDIRDSKNELTRGKADYMPQDGEALKIMLQKLDTQEKALVAMFTGNTVKSYTTKIVEIVPDSDITDKIIFRFSRLLGMLDPDDLAGEPYSITVADQHTVTMPTEEELEERKITGVVYNLPSKADVKISSGKNVVFSGEAPFGQFGTTDQLMPVLFNKDVQTKVKFNSVTGAVSDIQR